MASRVSIRSVILTQFARKTRNILSFRNIKRDYTHEKFDHSGRIRPFYEIARTIYLVVGCTESNIIICVNSARSIIDFQLRADQTTYCELKM